VEPVLETCSSCYRVREIRRSRFDSQPIIDLILLIVSCLRDRVMGNQGPIPSFRWLLISPCVSAFAVASFPNLRRSL
jgi:hypothetical protein